MNKKEKTIIILIILVISSYLFFFFYAFKITKYTGILKILYTLGKVEENLLYQYFNLMINR